MFEEKLGKSNVKSILTPIISFALLGVLVVGAVLFGRLVGERSDGCRPFGSHADNGDSATLLVWSEDDDALLLCDVPQESVEYVSPARGESELRIGDSLYRFVSEEDGEMQERNFADIEGNDLYEGTLRYSSEGTFSYRSSTPVYVKGEFGSLEDCMPFDEGFAGSGTFQPDRIESCWIETEYLPIGS